MTVPSIPFNQPHQTGNEQRYIAEAIAGNRLAGDGPWTVRCQLLLETSLGVPKALLTTSCTHALEMAALLFDIQDEDEVIVPDFAFVTTAAAFQLRGARLVFVDVRADTFNLDERLLESAITPRTKAIVPLHYAGVGCAMEPILAIARRHGVAVIEDNAHGLFGTYRGQYLGTFGALATQSFHETKNFTCGEGGALLVNDRAYAERAERIREKGTDRGRFFRGLVDKYTWVDVGSSYLPSDILAAYLAAQLDARAAIQAKRRHIWDYYQTHLAAWAAAHEVCLPTVPVECAQSYAQFHLLLPSLTHRQALGAHLDACGIASAFHYQPLHQSAMGRRYGRAAGACTVAESVSERLLRLPFFTDLTEEMQARVIAAIHRFVMPRTAAAE